MVHTPIRTCVGCRTRAPRSLLLRFVADPSSSSGVVADASGRLPGRGGYVHLDLGCVDAAQRRRALSRALRMSGAVDATRLRLYVEQALAGPAATGSTKSVRPTGTVGEESET